MTGVMHHVSGVTCQDFILLSVGPKTPSPEDPILVFLLTTYLLLHPWIRQIDTNTNAKEQKKL